MDFAKEWTICVCITLIISTILSLLTPSGRLSSFYKIIISIFIFMSFLYPFTNMEYKGYGFDNQIEDSSSELVDKMVENQVKNVLINNGIIGANVSSSTSLNDDEINIESVDIYIPDDYDSNEVQKIVFDELSINSRVVYIGS